MERILGLGNALTDVCVTLKDDSILKKLGLPKGGMTHISDELFVEVIGLIRKMDYSVTPGGSVANACRAMAHLGMPTGFVGKIGDDEFGRFYADSLAKVGTENLMIISDTYPSGVCSALISSDGERTFADHMAASLDLKAEDLTPEMMKGYQYLYIEGYLVQNHALIQRSAEMAKDMGLKVVMDLASYNVILQDKEFCRFLVDEFVDILFANEEEAHALTGKKPEEALQELAEKVELVIVKMGAKGALVQQGTTRVQADAVKVEQVVDTTGAGDHFSAGFLYGLLKGMPLKRCAELGSMVAAEAIQVIGALLPDNKWEEVKMKLRIEH